MACATKAIAGAMTVDQIAPSPCVRRSGLYHRTGHGD
jgi:hypothetical protein